MPPKRVDFVLTEVELERARQDQMWGEQNHSPLVWLPILLEEVGEVAEALNEWTHGTLSQKREAVKQYRTELIEVAAVAVAAVESLDRMNLGGKGS